MLLRGGSEIVKENYLELSGSKDKNINIYISEEDFQV